MKRWIFLFFSISWLLACNEPNSETTTGEAIENNEVANVIRNPISASNDIDPDFVPKMEFEELIYNFGEVKEGAKVEHIFKFENTGEVPLLIGDASTTCGCTVPTFPKEYIKPGQKGEIKVIFDTENFSGKQSKPITIIANTNPRDTKLHISGTVIGKPGKRPTEHNH